MIRHFAYTSFALTLSSVLILTTHPFLRDASSPAAPAIISISTGFIYFLLFQKLLRRYAARPEIFRGATLLLAFTALLPPGAWLLLTQWTLPAILVPMLVCVAGGIAGGAAAAVLTPTHPPAS